jgi:hypothetical protein
MGILYDDNILRSSDRDTQYRKTADRIAEPYILVQYKRYPGKYPLRLFGDVTVDLYRNAAYLNYETYRIGIKQSLPGKSDLLVKFSLIPNLPSTRTLSQQYSSLTLEAQKQMTSRLTAWTDVRWAGKNYNRNRYDTRLWEGTLNASYRFKAVKIGGGVGLETGNALGDATSDPSYKEQKLTTFCTLHPAAPARLTLKAVYASRDYTTSRASDTFRYGRTDLYRSYTVKYAHTISQHVEGQLALEHTGRGVSGIPMADKQLLEYTGNVYQFGVSWFY